MLAQLKRKGVFLAELFLELM